METLDDTERTIIKNNWNNMLQNIDIDKSYDIIIDKIVISCIDRSNNIEVVLKSTDDAKKMKIKRFEISKKARIMKFINDKETNEELIYNPSSIHYLTKYYKMEHPVYKQLEVDKSGEILDISVGPSNYEVIFNNSKIDKIYDDKFDYYIKFEEYYNYFNTFEINVSDFYDDSLVNKYSKKINDDKIIYNEEREKLIEFISNLKFANENFIFIIGCQNIGLSFTILQNVKGMNILYLNFEELFKKKKHSDKKKYIFRRLFALFNDYEEYKSFINDKVFKITGYDNILDVIKSLIISLYELIKENEFNGIIVLDNYDDFLVDSLKLTDNYIEDLYSKINKKNIKIIILGRGAFISNLLLNYFYEPKNKPSYILVKYIISLNLNIEKEIHNDNVKNGINEIEDYFKKKYNDNIEYIIYNLIILKNLPYLINKSYHYNIPFQFLKFNNENNNLEIDYQFDDIFDKNKKIIREYIAKLNTLKSFAELQNEKIKGYVFEDLVVSQFINNKAFKNIIFTESNKIEVDEIFKMEKIEKKTNLESGAILITQLKNGEVFDFGFIIEKNNIDYFVGGQIGLNKTQSDISKYIIKIQNNEKQIIRNINELTGRNVKEFRFVIIFNKEWQDDLFEKYSGLYEKIKKRKPKEKKTTSKAKKKAPKKKKETENNELTGNILKKTNFEKSQEDKEKDKLNHFNSLYGVQYCKNARLSYIFFSNTDFKFYDHENHEITVFDVDKLYSIKKGYEKFIFNEYNLIPFCSENEILTKKEKQLLLNAIKKVNKDIKDIEIKYELGKIAPLLTGTPYYNGILSITRDIKVFTYYDNTFTHFLLKKNKISIYPQSGKLFNDEYGKEYILSQFLVNLIDKNLSKIDNIIPLEEEEDNDGKLQNNEEDNDYNNRLLFLQGKKFGK